MPATMTLITTDHAVQQAQFHARRAEFLINEPEADMAEVQAEAQLATAFASLALVLPEAA